MKVLTIMLYGKCLENTVFGIKCNVTLL